MRKLFKKAASFASSTLELNTTQSIMKFLLIGLAIVATVCAQGPSAEYLPPNAGAATTSYESYAAPAVSAPAVSYAEPAYEASYEVAASEPAHVLADDGYRYKTVKRYRLRRRRDVSELSNDYLPPHAGAASTSYESYSAPAASAPAVSYAEPAYEASYEVAASEPAHVLADDGYRYRSVKRYRLRRRRRDVSELSNDYLPPHAGAATTSYESYSAPAASAPAVSYAEPAYEASYETAASEPAHVLADDGYRYKTVKRYRLRRRRDVSELSNDYLPPHAGAATTSYESYSAPAASAPAVSYAEPAYEASYETAASEPAHVLADDGYRYKTVKRYRLRRRRDVSELSNDYLPPHAGAATTSYESYSAPAASAPAVSYAEPAYEASYETAASEPAHVLADDGYRYKTVKRYRLRRRRDVSELSNDYLPPHAGAATTSYESYSAPAASAPAVSYAEPAYEPSYEVAASEPAHVLADDGYRYKTVKRYRLRRRRDVTDA